MDSTLKTENDQSGTIQYGGRTLPQLREEIYSDGQTLIARSLNGGMLGFHMGEGFPIDFISDQLLESMQFTYAHFMEVYHGNHLETILPEYQKEYTDAVRYAFTHNTVLDYICPAHTETGDLCWVRDVGKVMDKDNDIFIVLRSNVTHMFKNQQELSRKALIYEEKSRELEAMTASIPGGVSTISTSNNNYYVVSANAGFYSLFGYTAQQLKDKYQNHLVNLIYEQDRQFVHDTITEAQSQCKDIFEFEHRIIKKDGEIIWVLVRGSFADPKDPTLFSCVVIDITSRKKVEEEARINEKRFRIALSQTDSSIFDYDIRNCIMLHGDRSAVHYGLQQYTDNVPWSLVDDGIIHPDHVTDFLTMYDQIRAGAPTAFCNIKTRLSIGKYVWRKITMTTIYDEDGAPIQAIGILEDIDEQVRREESLRYQSERDPLTGIYNRRATLSHIDTSLSTRQESCVGALLLLDLDDFKHINDHYGHRFGDYVLKECTNRIQSLLNKDVIVGRFGGDEFIMFVNNLSCVSDAVTYAEQIAQAFAQLFSFQGTVADVSCSIGIAIVPNDGDSFDEMYQKADIALYEAKNSGKNSIVSYHVNILHSTEWVPYSNTEIDT